MQYFAVALRILQQETNESAVMMVSALHNEGQRYMGFLQALPRGEETELDDGFRPTWEGLQFGSAGPV